MASLQYHVYGCWSLFGTMCIDAGLSSVPCVLTLVSPQHPVYWPWSLFSTLCIDAGLSSAPCVLTPVSPQYPVYWPWSLFGTMCINAGLSPDDGPRGVPPSGLLLQELVQPPGPAGGQRVPGLLLPTVRTTVQILHVLDIYSRYIWDKYWIYYMYLYWFNLIRSWTRL